MPIKVQNHLPAKEILEKENIFVMDERRAVSQNIRPLRIAILNLMPLKEDTELDLLRVLSNFYSDRNYLDEDGIPCFYSYQLCAFEYFLCEFL